MAWTGRLPLQFRCCALPLPGGLRRLREPPGPADAPGVSGAHQERCTVAQFQRGALARRRDDAETHSVHVGPPARRRRRRPDTALSRALPQPASCIHFIRTDGPSGRTPPQPIQLHVAATNTGVATVDLADQLNAPKPPISHSLSHFPSLPLSPLYLFLSFLSVFIFLYHYYYYVYFFLFSVWFLLNSKCYFNFIQLIGIDSMFRFIVAFLLKTIISVFIGMEPSVLSALLRIVNIDISLLYLYILRVSVQSIVHPLNVHNLLCLFKPPFCLFPNSKLEICVSDHYIVF